MRGAGRFGVVGSGGGGVHRYSHRAAQLEEEQLKSEHRAARCVCGRHSYLREVLGRKRGSSVLTTWGSESEFVVCAFCLARIHVSERARFPDPTPPPPPSRGRAFGPAEGGSCIRLRLVLCFAKSIQVYTCT